MTMEDLTKTQIVLLAILVSFVTSTATSIITTSLLDEAPPQVSRTVNRVVERTIERVAPEDNEDDEITQEVVRETVVVKEDDMVVQAVEQNESSVVRIRTANEEQAAVGVGFVASENGFIIADGAFVAEDTLYRIETPDGVIDVETVHDPHDTVAVLAAVDDVRVPFPAATIASSDPKLGQTVVALGGAATNAIAVGRVTNLVTPSERTQATTTPDTQKLQTTRIATDIQSIELGSGGPLVNLSGEVVGMKVQADGVGRFVPASVIQATLSEVNDGQAENEDGEGEQ